MNTNLTPEQARQRYFEELYPAGYYVRHKATHRRYFIVDTSEDGCTLIQAVRGIKSSAVNAPRLERTWDEMRSFYGVRRD